ncbi:saccharopine dehydrogenase family protein [Candidatus Litorirhabdus singularis]|uniref:saccharopine dehydrogenase family protein n=1 Tax=Candidatus Litorirhabdus singularis TaxID=2518993 RepID=UPI00242F4D18|nr:saccharopine dehydrogenase NADP-binding domain-containing protein [Candidatus Litorirhabdus singularis]
MKVASTLSKILFVTLALTVGSSGIALGDSVALSADVLEKLPHDRKGKVLIYGAYGFTGTGISRLAADYGITPVLSGRNETKLKALAEEVGYDYITLSLDDNHDNLVRVLNQFELVMHIAGPYTYTSEPMINAAIEAKTHYVDLTGENHVIQAQLDRDQEFLDAGIMVMPAVGYDVVPTDCLNLYVAGQLDNPIELTVVMNGNYTAVEGAAASRGTLKSGLEMLSRPILSRQNGEMVAMGQPKVITREVDGQTETLVQIPWADMMTSWVSTGIPNIEIYQVQEGELPGWVLWVAQREWGKNLLIWMIDKYFPEGPPPEAQAKRQTQLVATAINAAGESFSAEMITPEAYLLTFHSSLIIARNIIDGQWEPGFQTPAKVYGPGLALQVPGVSRRDL